MTHFSPNFLINNFLNQNNFFCPKKLKNILFFYRAMDAECLKVLLMDGVSFPNNTESLTSAIHDTDMFMKQRAETYGWGQDEILRWIFDSNTLYNFFNLPEYVLGMGIRGRRKEFYSGGIDCFRSSSWRENWVNRKKNTRIFNFKNGGGRGASVL